MGLGSLGADAFWQQRSGLDYFAFAVDTPRIAALLLLLILRTWPPIQALETDFLFREIFGDGSEAVYNKGVRIGPGQTIIDAGTTRVFLLTTGQSI